jgi:hypothetical protein
MVALLEFQRALKMVAPLADGRVVLLAFPKVDLMVGSMAGKLVAW